MLPISVQKPQLYRFFFIFENSDSRKCTNLHFCGDTPLIITGFLSSKNIHKLNTTRKSGSPEITRFRESLSKKLFFQKILFSQILKFFQFLCFSKIFETFGKNKQLKPYPTRALRLFLKKSLN